VTKEDAAITAISLILSAQREHPSSPMLRARYLLSQIEASGDMDLAEEIFFELIRAALLPSDDPSEIPASEMGIFRKIGED
jgi:hypothetical protein